MADKAAQKKSGKDVKRKPLTKAEAQDTDPKAKEAAPAPKDAALDLKNSKN